MVELNVNHINWDENEIIANMGYHDTNVQVEIRLMVNELVKGINDKINPCIYMEKIQLDNQHILDEMFMSSEQKSEFENFTEIYCLLVTIGSNLDNLVEEKTRLGNHLEAYVIDVIGSYAVSQLMDIAYKYIKDEEDNKANKISRLYSPGSGSWSLEGQGWLFDKVIDKTSIDKKANLKLTKDMLLIPVKSMSGCIGVSKKLFGNERTVNESCSNSCKTCQIKNCNMSKNRMFNVIVYDGNTTIEINAAYGANLLQLLHTYGIGISAPCNGKGRCGNCKVIITNGIPPVTNEEKRLLSDEEINSGIRLACFVTVKYGMECIIHQSKMKVLADEQKDYSINIYPQVLLKPIDIKDEKNYELLFQENRIKEVQCNDIPIYGVAIDIGTTTVVVTVVDLKTGDILGTLAEENDQRSFGSDVISRIGYCNEKEKGLEILQQSIIRQINIMLDKISSNQNLLLENIYHTVVVGNPTMIHLFLGISPKSLGEVPYSPTFSETTDFLANKIGLHVKGYVTFPSLISGFVGSDITAAMLATIGFQQKRVCLLIDLGTNGEMVLSTGESYYCCSTAAGPAFEAANIYNGTGSIPGAITSIDMVTGNITTISNKKPVGICGTGVIQITAQLIKEKYIDNTGLLQSNGEGLFKVEIDSDKLNEVILNDVSPHSKKIVFKQKDIRQVQMAKAAIAAGIETLCKESGVSFSNIDEVYLAGGFGTYLDIESAIMIGLIPEEFRGKTTSIGHAALKGAKRFLLSVEEVSRLEHMVRNSKTIDLALNIDFQESFIRHMSF